MEVDKELLKHVAEVARLELTEKEIREFLLQLKEIIEAFSEIQKVDTKNTRPSYHPVELKNHVREDRAASCLTNEDALKNTEHRKDGYFRGPRIL